MHLKQSGITTALQLAKYPAPLARKMFSVELERTVRELNGQVCKQWDEARAVFDGLNQRYGQNTIFLGAQGIEPKWQMRRQFLTPQYTTCWGDIPKILC